MSCPICYENNCKCRYIHKAKYGWRDDDERLPMRTAMCGKQRWEVVTPYKSRITCPQCLMAQTKPASRQKIYGRKMRPKQLVIKRYFTEGA